LDGGFGGVPPGGGVLLEAEPVAVLDLKESETVGSLSGLLVAVLSVPGLSTPEEREGAPVAVAAEVALVDASVGTFGWVSGLAVCSLPNGFAGLASKADSDAGLETESEAGSEVGGAPSGPVVGISCSSLPLLLFWSVGFTLFPLLRQRMSHHGFDHGAIVRAVTHYYVLAAQLGCSLSDTLAGHPTTPPGLF
jgi:hypothetical protein